MATQPGPTASPDHAAYLRGERPLPAYEITAMVSSARMEIKCPFCGDDVSYVVEPPEGCFIVQLRCLACRHSLGRWGLDTRHSPPLVWGVRIFSAKALDTDPRGFVVYQPPPESVREFRAAVREFEAAAYPKRLVISPRKRHHHMAQGPCFCGVRHPELHGVAQYVFSEDGKKIKFYHAFGGVRVGEVIDLLCTCRRKGKFRRVRITSEGLEKLVRCAGARPNVVVRLEV